MPWFLRLLLALVFRAQKLRIAPVQCLCGDVPPPGGWLMHMRVISCVGLHRLYYFGSLPTGGVV